MKLWAALVVLVYAVMITVLVMPACLMLHWAPPDVTEIYGAAITWMWVGALVLGEVVLLFVPVRMATRRMRPQRALWIPIVATIFFLWVMAIFVALNLCFMVFGEKSDLPFDMDKVVWIGGWNAFWLITLLFWILWGLIFTRLRDRYGPETFLRALMRRLMAGSILEALIAIPTHIVVRHRNECCTPVFSALGLYTGVAVMLMAFGPGVVILYARRRGMLLGEGKLCRNCGYDLRATPDRCPECGTTAVKGV